MSTGSTIAQVVPAVPSFSVDDGFSYAVPAGASVAVGSIVRVPLGGRRIRGYVTGLRSGEPAGLKQILRVSSPIPAFGERLLETLRSLAIHYVAPQSVILAKAAPPNLPGSPRPRRVDGVEQPGPGPLAEVVERLAAGKHDRPHYLLGRAPWHDTIARLAGPVLAAQRSGMVVMPTVAEMLEMADQLDDAFPGRVVRVTSAYDARSVTAVWSLTRRHPGLLLVGTREIAFWPVANLALAVMVGEGRKGMKERSSPTIHAREVVRRRAAVERFGLVFTGSVPTSDIVATGIPITRVGGTRVWPLVEIVDRNDEPPGSGYVTSQARSAIRSVTGRGGRVFVFTHRRGYAPAFRCSRCRLVRTCPNCDARADRGAGCQRCGATLGPCVNCGGKAFEPLGAGAERIIELLGGSGSAGPVGSEETIWVGTERDLPAVRNVDLAVVIDADGIIHAPNYRAGEDALRLLARVAETIGPGSGRRCIIQTSRPADPVIASLRHGEPVKYLDSVIEARARTRLPPGGEVLVVELDRSGGADEPLRRLAADRAEVFGPADRGGRIRWLVQGADLRPVRIGLRRLVQEWRDSGIRVRIDVDPVDL